MIQDYTYGETIGTELYIPVIRHRGFLLKRKQYPIERIALEPLLDYYPSDPAPFATKHHTEMVFKGCLLEFEEAYAVNIIGYFDMSTIPYSVVRNDSAIVHRTAPYALSIEFDIEVGRLDELTAWLKLLARTNPARDGRLRHSAGHR